MKKILFDLISLKSVQGTKYHGGAEYSRELLLELQKYNDSAEIYYLFDSEFEDIDERVKGSIPLEKVVFIDNMEQIPKLLVDSSFDTFISGLPYRYRKLDFGKTECFFTIHGLRRIELPYDNTELRYAVNWRERVSFIVRRMIPRIYVKLKKKYFADFFECSRNLKIIVVSEHTKYSILSNFKDITGDKLKVSYSFLVRAETLEIHPEVKSIGKFYVMVSTHRWGKNAYRAVMAFDKLFSLDRLEGKVVLLGMSEKIFRNFRVKNKDRFIIRNYVERDQYESYLKAAYALVYPTLNEGFGYPPYEAMKYGTPVAMSAVTSLTEIYSNNSLFFNPVDIDEIAIRILELENWDLKKTKSSAIIAEAENLLSRQIRMTDELFSKIIKT